MIAFGYTSHLDAAYLLGALGVLLLLAVANRMRVMSRTFYCWAGIVVWYLFLQSGDCRRTGRLHHPLHTVPECEEVHRAHP